LPYLTLVPNEPFLIGAFARSHMARQTTARWILPAPRTDGLNSLFVHVLCTNDHYTTTGSGRTCLAIAAIEKLIVVFGGCDCHHVDRSQDNVLSLEFPRPVPTLIQAISFLFLDLRKLIKLE
jgi:hypothetical protein